MLLRSVHVGMLMSRIVSAPAGTIFVPTSHWAMLVLQLSCAAHMVAHALGHRLRLSWHAPLNAAHALGVIALNARLCSGVWPGLHPGLCALGLAMVQGATLVALPLSLVRSSEARWRRSFLAGLAPSK